MTTIFENKAVYRISEFIDFIGQLEAEEKILIRDLEEGKPVFSGELDSDGIFEGIEWFESVINDLELIESHTGKSFRLTEFIDEEAELHILTTSELLTEGETFWPFSINSEIIEGKEEELLRIYEEDDTKLNVKMEEFYVTILNQEIQIGDIEISYPNPELPNPDTIREKIGQPAPIEFEIKPSEEATVELLE